MNLVKYLATRTYNTARYRRDELLFNAKILAGIVKKNPLNAFALHKMRDKSFLTNSHKCVFVHIPKTAGMTVNKKLVISPSHTTALEYRKRFPDQFSEYFTFAFVRNPWDRLVSTFSYYRKGGRQYPADVHYQHVLRNEYANDFTAFTKGFLDSENALTCTHTRPQYGYVCDEEETLMVDFIGRFENFNDDFGLVCDRLNVNPGTPRITNRSNHRHYRDYYTQETKTIVGRVYEKDIDLFGYCF